MIPFPKALKRLLNFIVFFEWTARRSGRGGEGKSTDTGRPFAATPNPSRRADTQRVIRHGWRANMFGGTALRSGLRGLTSIVPLAVVVTTSFCVATPTAASNFETAYRPQTRGSLLSLSQCEFSDSSGHCYFYDPVLACKTLLAAVIAAYPGYPWYAGMTFTRFDEYAPGRAPNAGSAPDNICVLADNSGPAFYGPDASGT